MKKRLTLILMLFFVATTISTIYSVDYTSNFSLIQKPRFCKDVSITEAQTDTAQVTVASPTNSSRKIVLHSIQVEGYAKQADAELVIRWQGASDTYGTLQTDARYDINTDSTIQETNILVLPLPAFESNTTDTHIFSVALEKEYYGCEKGVDGAKITAFCRVEDGSDTCNRSVPATNVHSRVTVFFWEED